MTSQILRISVKGSLPNGEVWSVNPCWEIDGATGSLVTASECQTIATGLLSFSFPAGMQALMAGGTTVDGYRVEARQVTGELEAVAESQRPTPIAGSGGSTHSYQSSLVISLMTPYPGAQGRGRLYWPATGLALDATTYRVGAATMINTLAAAKSLLTGMETVVKATLPNANLTVWSRTRNGFANVNAIRVGNVLDTQRRRRDSLTEAYSIVSFP